MSSVYLTEPKIDWREITEQCISIKLTSQSLPSSAIRILKNDLPNSVYTEKGKKGRKTESERKNRTKKHMSNCRQQQKMRKKVTNDSLLQLH